MLAAFSSIGTREQTGIVRILSDKNRYLPQSPIVILNIIF